MKRSNGYFRYVKHKSICRKKALSRSINNCSWYNIDGKYSKGKIRCDCKICKFGRHYGIPTVRTLREQEAEKIDRMEAEIA